MYKLLEYLSPFEHNRYCKTKRVVHRVYDGQYSSPCEWLLRQRYVKSKVSLSPGPRMLLVNVELASCIDVNPGYVCTSFAQSLARKASITCTELETTFCSRRLAVTRVACTLLTRSFAS